jgi:hypothetical protein
VSEARDIIAAALRKRAENGGRHLHHSECIHNLTPEKQVALRGKTVEWWTRVIGPLPDQITPEQWETEPPARQDRTP